MYTINCKSGATAIAAAAYFMQHKRQTKVAVNMVMIAEWLAGK